MRAPIFPFGGLLIAIYSGYCSDVLPDIGKRRLMQVRRHIRQKQAQRCWRRDGVQQDEGLTGRVRQIQASAGLSQRAQGRLYRLWLSRTVHGSRELVRMRSHHTEVDLAWRPSPRLTAQEERDLAESLAAIEGAGQARNPRELSVVRCPVRQGDAELLDTQGRLGVLQCSDSVRSANEAMTAC